MCGFVCIVTGDGSAPDRRILEAMSERIVHRGPDGNGIWIGGHVALAHRRLAIIDVSDNGHQPMSNEDGTVWIAFNGEIYNHLELRAELQAAGHRFRSASDTECIIHAYEDDPEGFIHRLRGMFAFAIWDGVRRTLTIARDRLGIKPVYYWSDGGSFIAASEIKALLAHPTITAPPNMDAVAEYLHLGHGHDDSTWYSGIRALLPGDRLLIRDGTAPQVLPYWRPSPATDNGATPRVAAERLRASLGEAVALHLRSDVPVGAHLSGGIDSSSIVCLASKSLHGHLQTFSGAFPGSTAFDERDYIARVVKATGTSHHEILPGPEDLERDLSRIIWHLDHPIAGPGCFPQWQLCKLISSQGVKVVCGGQGGDELLSGYLPYLRIASRGLLTRTGWGLGQRVLLPMFMARAGMLRPAEFLSRLHRAQGQRPLVRQPLAPFLERRSATIPPEWAADPYRRHAWTDIRHHLPALLHVEDRTSMGWSIESRVPLLDHRFVEECLRLPEWIKVRGAVLKRPLRDAMRGIVPDAILDRTDKKGFPTPTSLWLRGRLSSWMTGILREGLLVSAGAVDGGQLQELIVEHIGGVGDHGSVLWRALCAEIWFQNRNRMHP